MLRPMEGRIGIECDHVATMGDGVLLALLAATVDIVIKKVSNQVVEIRTWALMNGKSKDSVESQNFNVQICKIRFSLTRSDVQ